MKMNRHEDGPGWPDFETKFHVLVDDIGRKTILEEYGDRLVGYRDDVAVVDAIAKYCHEKLTEVPGSDLQHNSLVAVKNLWLALTRPLKEKPAPVAELSFPGLTFQRLPFDAPAGIPAAPTPCFGDFLKRCSQWRPVAAFIGSLFYPEADRQQYLYLYGQGNDGKGALMRVLWKLFGPAGVSLEPKGKDDRFWNMKLFGRRYVMFPDCEDFEFFSSPAFKSLTGNDPIFFEDKGKPGFTAIPTCKIIVGSNHKPNITSQRSDLRRLIFVEVESVPEEDVDARYEAELFKEAAGFLSLCKHVYLEDCPSHGPIKCEKATHISAEAEERYLSIFQRHFAVDKASKLRADRIHYVLKKEGIFSNKDVSKLKSAWARAFGVKSRLNVDGLTIYEGLRWEPKDYEPLYGAQPVDA